MIEGGFPAVPERDRLHPLRTVADAGVLEIVDIVCPAEVEEHPDRRRGERPARGGAIGREGLRGAKGLLAREPQHMIAVVAALVDEHPQRGVPGEAHDPADLQGEVVGVILLPPVDVEGDPVIVAQAHALSAAQLDYYHGLAARGLIRLITTRAELAVHRAAWPADGVLGLVVLMENGDPIVEPAEVPWWAERGVRIVGPAWQATRYCGGTKQPGPLTDLGRALLPELAAAGMILDVSHMAEESFWQALDLWKGPVIASHSNSRELVAERVADRHLSDAMIKALVERDAVIGAVFYNAFIAAEYQRGDPKERYGLDRLVRHIDRVCQLAGSARHSAIGSDLDGGLGSEHIARELDSAADLPRLAEALSAAGYSDADVAAIMGDNWLRLLGQALPEE